MKQINYNPQVDTVSFNPDKAPDYTEALDRNQRIIDRSLRNQQQGIQANAAAELFNASQDGEVLKELGAFSKTLLSFTESQTKRLQEEQRIDEMYDFLMGPGEPDTSPDAEVVNQGLAQADNASRVQLQVEEFTGNQVTSEQARNAVATPLGNAVVSERGQLLRAQVSYSPYMQSFLNSNEAITIGGQRLTVRDAIASGDTRLINAVVSQGRANFIREMGLAGVSKKQFVSILGPTIIQTDSALGGSAARNAIEAKRKAQRESLESTGFTVGTNSTVPTVEGNWRELADTMWLSGAYSTRGDANEAALKTVLKGLVTSGNTDAIAQLAGTEKIPGQAKTALGLQYGELFYEANEAALGRVEKLDARRFKELESNLYRELGELGDSATPEQRQAVINRNADAMEAAGLYKQARALREKAGDLLVDGSADFNYQRLLEGISEGSIKEEDINKAQLRGDINSSQANALRSSFKNSPFGKAAVLDKDSKEIAADFADRFEADFLVAAGLRRDPTGNIQPLRPGQETLVSPGEAKIIIGKAKREIRNNVSTALQQNPGVQGNERIKLVTQVVNDWYSQNVESNRGKFYIGDVQTKTGKIETTEAARNRFRALIQSPTLQATPTPSRQLYPLDFTAMTRNGMDIPDEYVRDFNPLRGDKIFAQDVVREMREGFLNGEVDPRLKRHAERFGMTPVNLLNQQLGAYGEDVISSNARSKNGLNNLQSLGFSENAAIALARHGYNADSAPNLRSHSPVLWRTLSNPYSTQRQLDKAFEDAGLVFTPTGNGKERTIQVGKHLLQEGYSMWQHPNFDYERGYVNEGGQRVMQRSYNSAHNHQEALDFPLSHNGEAKLDQLAGYLRVNKERFGINELLWRTAGHYDHLHVSFYQ